MDKIKGIDLPDELLPSQEMYDKAREIDRMYLDMYNHLRYIQPDIKATELIPIMAQYFVERLALMVGEKINERDKRVLRGVLERHIVEIVFIES